MTVNFYENGVELRPLVDSDLSESPAVYDNDIDMHAELRRITAGGLLFPSNDTNPHFYLRMFEPDKVRWGGIIRCGNGPLEPHTSVHYQDIAQSGAEIVRYHKISNNPLTYTIGTKNPFSEFTWTAKSSHWIEGEDGCVLDVKAEYFPFAIFIHLNSPFHSTYFVQFLTLTGTYEGHPIKAISWFDRPCVPKGTGERGLDSPIKEGIPAALQYVNCWYAGFREDGRKELVWAVIPEHNGEGVGIYWIEGQDPIVAFDVTLEADWQHLNYAKDDPTVCFTKATWRFGGKRIHFIGKWGGKGQLEKPRMDRKGLCQVYGTWYEGDTEYKHTEWTTYNEISHMPEDVVKRMGFTIL